MIGCAVALAATASLGPAQAQQSQASTLCDASEADGVSLDRKISGCSTEILSGTLSNSDLALAYTNRGIAYSAKGQLDRAIQDFDQAIKLDANNVIAYYNRGIAHSAKGQFDCAIQDYDEAIERSPSARRLLGMNNAIAYYNRGIAYSAKGQLDRAIQDFDQAIKLDASDADFFHARSLAQKGDKKSAAADLAAVRWFSSITRALSQLPPTVAEEVAHLIQGCRNVPYDVHGRRLRLDVRLNEIVYQVSLSGPGSRDYIVSMRKAPFRCGYCGGSGSGVCAFSVFLNPTPGRWVGVAGDPLVELENRGGWYTVRRRGRTLLVIKHSCDVTRKDVCATLYRASGDSLVVIDEALACSGARQRKGSSSKQPKHEGHCAATAYYDYHNCRRQCGPPFTSKRRLSPGLGESM
jgi:lipoprotein NlpI